MLVKLIVNTEYKLLFCEAAVMYLIYGTVWTDKVHNTIVNYSLYCCYSLDLESNENQVHSAVVPRIIKLNNSSTF